MRRGQVSLFILFGIIILLIVGSLFFTREKSEQKEKQHVSQDAVVEAYLNFCLQETANNAVSFVSKQGGYYSPEEFVFFYSNVLHIPVYYDEKAMLPTQQDIEESLAEYIVEKEDELCSFETLQKQGYTFTKGTMNVQTTLSSKNAVFLIAYSLEVQKNDQKKTIEKISIQVSTRMKEMYEQAAAIIQHREEQGSLCISCMSEWAFENNFFIEDFTDGETGKTIIRITDGTSLIGQEPQVFQFAIKEKIKEAALEWWMQ